MRRFKIKIKRRLTEGRILLNEITFASAVNNLGAKKMRKAVRRWHDERPRFMVTVAGGRRLDQLSPEEEAEFIQNRVGQLKDWLLDIVPEDLEDNQKGLVVTWLARLARDLETGYMTQFLEGNAPGRDPWSDFEMFFHYQQFMGEKDLNRIADLDELSQVVRAARPQIEKHQEGKDYGDVSKGTEVFRDDDEWFIAALHNKGAACSFGKGTDWCTAAPGLDYFADYYEENDPLFYFEDRDPSVAYPRNRPPEDLDTGDSPRYQFHYGSLQFMDENDNPLEPDDMHALHRRLMQTRAPNKYPIIKKYDRKVKIEREDTSPEELHQLVEDDMTHYEELVDIALHSNVSEESLRKLMVVADPATPDYVGGGDQRYATALKGAVARRAHTPELLEDLWEITKSAATSAAEETEKRLRRDQKHYEEKYGPNWAEERLPLQLRIARGQHVAVWKSIAFNANVSNDLLKQIAEYDGGEYLKTFAAEKILAREEGFVGEKELRPIQIRGRVVRRIAAEEDSPTAARWDEETAQNARSLVQGLGGFDRDDLDLAESKIYAQWKKIIN